MADRPVDNTFTEAADGKLAVDRILSFSSELGDYHGAWVGNSSRTFELTVTSADGGGGKKSKSLGY